MAQNLSLGAGIPDANNTSTTPPTVANPYVGDWSLDEDFPNAMVTMAADVAGTLFFDFYDQLDADPTGASSPTSTFPVTGYSYNGSGFNEFHQATKGPRWFRARFVPDADASTFRINTYFVVKSEGNLPLNQGIQTDQDATITRSILEGNVFDDQLQPTNTYSQVGVLPNGALPVGLAPQLLIDETITLPSGADFVIDPVFNAEANAFDSGWIPAAAFHSQLFRAKLDGACPAYLMNAPDDQGTNFTGGDNPFQTTTAGFPTGGGSMVQEDYFRVVIKNTTGSSVAGQVRSEGHFTALGSVLVPLNAPVFDFFPAPLTQTVAKGRQPDGDYVNTPADGTAYYTGAPLLADGEASSGWIDTDGYKEVQVFITTDKVGSVAIEYTFDANAAVPVAAGQPLTYDITPEIIAAGQLYIPLPTILDGIRVTYTNGDEDQGLFGLSLDFKTAPSALPQSSYADTIQQNSRAVQTRGTMLAPDDSGALVTIGRDGEGSSVNVEVTTDDTEKKIAPTTDYSNGQLNVGTAAAAQLPTPSLSLARSLSITNVSEDANLYWGKVGVSAANGDVILPLATKDLDISGALPPYLIMGGAGGTTNTVHLEADTVDSSANVTSPSNILVSDDTYGEFTQSGSTATISGFDGTTDISLDIQSVYLVLEGRKEPSAAGETVAFNSVAGGTAAGYPNALNLTVSSVPLVANGYYIVAVAVRDENSDVTNVTNDMGFSGFTILGDTGTASAESRTILIQMNGTPTSAGQIQVFFDEGFDHAAAAVTVLDNVKTASPVTDTDTFASSADTEFFGTASGTENGLFFVAVGSEQTTVDDLNTPVGNTERHESGSTAGNDQTIHIRTAPIAATGSVAYQGDMSGFSDVTAVAVCLEPSDALDPIIVVSHSEGSTTLDVTLTAESDDFYEVDITGDAAWTPALIDSMTVTTESTTVGNAAAQIDVSRIRVVEASDTTRITYSWVGDPL